MSKENEIHIEQVLPVAPEVAWAYLTEPRHMKHWFFEDMPDFKAETGFETGFVMHSDTRDFSAHWRVEEVMPETLLRVAWTYAEYPGKGRVTFEVIPEVGQTRVVVRNSGLETFPQDIPEFKPESCRGGWEYFLNQRLKAYAEGLADG